jgi:hypothetical protein
MADPERAHEPSMEEILASIRRIISDDGEAEAEEPEALEPEEAEPEPEPEPEPEDVEALADAAFVKAAEAPPVEEPEEDGEPAEEAVEEPDEGEEETTEVFELTDVLAEPEEDLPDEDEPDNHLEQFRPAEVTFAEPEVRAADPPRQGLLSPEAEASASAAFGALAGNILAHSGGARTLEQIVEDMLRPMLKAWLDANLPPMVEQLVRAEIERLARRAK